MDLPADDPGRYVTFEMFPLKLRDTRPPGVFLYTLAFKEDYTTALGVFAKHDE